MNPKRVASVWWCGDDYCDCCQAQIHDVFPSDGQKPGINRTLVATGRFYTDGDGWVNGIAQIEMEHLALLYGAEVET